MTEDKAKKNLTPEETREFVATCDRIMDELQALLGSDLVPEHFKDSLREKVEPLEQIKKSVEEEK